MIQVTVKDNDLKMIAISSAVISAICGSSLYMPVSVSFQKSILIES